MLTAMKVFALVLGLAVTGVLGSGVAGDAGFPEGDVRGDEEITEAVFEEALRCGDGDGCRYVAIGLFLRWGLLPPVRNGTGGGNRSAVDLPSEEAREEMLDRDLPVIRWDGFVQVTRGGARLVRTVEFERGDLVYPRNNRLVLEWRSATQPHWDGILAVVAVPLGEVPQAHVTFHTDPWSHIFELRELVGGSLRVTVDRLGHEVEIRSDLVRP